MNRHERDRGREGGREGGGWGEGEKRLGGGVRWESGGWEGWGAVMGREGGRGGN
jgi:hypothetical protein